MRPRHRRAQNTAANRVFYATDQGVASAAAMRRAGPAACRRAEQALAAGGGASQTGNDSLAYWPTWVGSVGCSRLTASVKARSTPEWLIAADANSRTPAPLGKESPGVTKSFFTCLSGQIKYVYKTSFV